jgi:hypothetical protein
MKLEIQNSELSSIPLLYHPPGVALIDEGFRTLADAYEALCQKLSTTLVKVRWKFSDDAL